MEEKVFRRQPYSALFILSLSFASPFVFGLVFLLLLFLIERIFGTVSYPAAIASGSFSLIVSICYLIKIWSFGLTKIIITEQNLTIKSLFRRNQFNWPEIKEFGRILRPITTEGVSSDTWDYYIKTGQNKNKIFISNSQVNDAAHLCYLVFKYALNARFVTMLRHQLGLKYEIQEWPKSEIQAWENSEITKEAAKVSTKYNKHKKINIKKIVVREGLILFGAILLAFFIGAFFLPYSNQLVLGGQKFPYDPPTNILSQCSRWEIIKMTEFFLVLILYPLSLFVRIIVWVIKALKAK